MQWRTFEEWSKKGYRIKKGEKSILRQPDGLPLFNKEQVKKLAENYDPDRKYRDGYNNYTPDYTEDDYDFDSAFSEYGSH